MEPLRRLRVEDLIEVWCAAEISMRAHAPGLDGLAPSEGVGTQLASLVERIAEAVRPTTSLTAFADAVDRCLDPSADRLQPIELVGEFFGGIGDLCRNGDEIDSTRLAMAFEAGADRMQASATGKALDASVVTVGAAVAEVALRAADSGLPLAEMLIEAADGGLDALEARSTAQLLEAASATEEESPSSGVDPWAAGLLVIIDAFVAVVHGDDPELPSWEFEPEDDEATSTEPFRYEVSLVVAAGPEAAPLLAVTWRSLGGDVEVAYDSAASLLVGSVATDDIGAVIEAAIAIGRPSRIVVRDRHS